MDFSERQVDSCAVLVEGQDGDGDAPSPFLGGCLSEGADQGMPGYGLQDRLSHFARALAVDYPYLRQARQKCGVQVSVQLEHRLLHPHTTEVHLHGRRVQGTDQKGRTATGLTLEGLLPRAFALQPLATAGEAPVCLREGHGFGYSVITLANSIERPHPRFLAPLGMTLNVRLRQARGTGLGMTG